jgi:hypothetical protein
MQALFHLAEHCNFARARALHYKCMQVWMIPAFFLYLKE